MQFDALKYEYPSKRNVIYGTRGMVCTSQPQAAQAGLNTVDFHMNPQDALNAPRWQWMEGKTIAVEKDFPTHIVEELIRKGHKMQIPSMNTSFGRGQIIWRNEEGVLCGATEPRADGTVAVW